MEKSLPVAERPRRPEWMKVRAPSKDSAYFDVKKLIHGALLNTICEEARCPNIAECWGRGTATFQILGDTCTRACRYCYVHSGKPDSPPDPLEPLRLAAAAAKMNLKHVVVTSVDRDDVPDRGAGHYAATIRALKHKVPEATIEVLTPDFLDVEEEALRTVLAECPDVFNHNIETVRRLHARMRGAKASYDKALWLLARAKEIADYPVLTKSGIIVGLGETNDEVVDTMRDLREHGVDVVTIGQYLQPSAKHATIDRWVHPDEFRWFREQGEALGFGSVFSGPLVRSSYRADEQRHAHEANCDPQQRRARHPHLAEGHEGDEGVEDRNGRLDDRRKARVDPRLAPRQQPERDRRVHERDHHEPLPVHAQLSGGLTGADHERDEQSERQRREAESARYQRRRRKLAHRHLDEQERGAPDQRERDQHRQVAPAHTDPNVDWTRPVRRLDSTI